MNKTLIIYTDFMDLPKLFLADGDHSHLDGVVINTVPYDPHNDENLTSNSSNNTVVNQETLNDLLFDEHDQWRQAIVKPTEIAILFGLYGSALKVINVGFAP